MKVIEKVLLIIFSIVVLCVSAFMIIYKIGIIGNTELKSVFEFLSTGNVGIVILIINILLIILSIKNIFFSSKIKKERTDGILLENENGKLLITKNTIESLVNSVTKDIVGAESASSKIILNKENNLIVLITIVINQEIDLKLAIKTLQAKVKDTIKQTVDLDVKEVNVRVKNIAIKQNEQKTVEAKSKVPEDKSITAVAKTNANAQEKESISNIQTNDQEIKENNIGGKNE